MNGKKIDESLNVIARLILSSIKDHADRGLGLTPSSLTASLKSNPAVRTLLMSPNELQAADSLQSDSERVDYDALKHEVARIQQQKTDLVQKLDAVEAEASEADGFYRQALLLLTDMSYSAERGALQDHLGQFRQSIKSQADVGVLKEGFSQLKDSLLKETSDRCDDNDIEELKSRKIPTFFNKWLKLKDTDPPDDKTFSLAEYIHCCRETFYEILNELRLAAGELNIKPWPDITRRIEGAREFDDFLSLREDILKLLQVYFSKINVEREETAAFVKEVGQRLVDFERNLTDSVSSVHQAHRANADFSVSLEKQLHELKENADFSKSLAELKNTVIVTLSTIRETIESKNHEDRLFKSNSDKKMMTLRRHVEEMQHEIIQANEQAKRMEKELLEDPLTGAFNRRAYERRAADEMERFQRYQRVFSLLVLDIDHFKNFNDRYGHAIGDKCLVELVSRIKPLLRKNDMLARYGGEEFVVLLPETSGKGAVTVAEKLRRTIENIDFIHKKETLKISISIGVTETTAADSDYQFMFMRADKALYEAKNNGRNRVVLR